MTAATIRPAAKPDQRTIRRMVNQARLDPTGLRWQNFVVAEQGDEIVGIGQVRPATPELGSLVVSKNRRGQGIGGQLIRALLDDHDKPIYLECRAGLASYYARFGFERIDWREVPFPLKVKAGLGHLLGFDPAVMVHT